MADRERYLAEPRPGATNYAMTARIGLPVCRAIAAFGRGRYGEAVDQLMPIRHYQGRLGCAAGDETAAAEAERRARELVRASGAAPGAARRGAARA